MCAHEFGEETYFEIRGQKTSNYYRPEGRRSKYEVPGVTLLALQMQLNKKGRRAHEEVYILILPENIIEGQRPHEGRLLPKPIRDQAEDPE